MGGDSYLEDDFCSSEQNPYMDGDYYWEDELWSSGQDPYTSAEQVCATSKASIDMQWETHAAVPPTMPRLCTADFPVTSIIHVHHQACSPMPEPSPTTHTHTYTSRNTPF